MYRMLAFSQWQCHLAGMLGYIFWEQLMSLKNFRCIKWISLSKWKKLTVCGKQEVSSVKVAAFVDPTTLAISQRVSVAQQHCCTSTFACEWQQSEFTQPQEILIKSMKILVLWGIWTKVQCCHFSGSLALLGQTVAYFKVAEPSCYPREGFKYLGVLLLGDVVLQCCKS